MANIKYLNLKPGELYHLTIAEDDITHTVYHWQGSRSAPCEGDGCPYCRANKPKRDEGWLDVYIARELRRWSFPWSVAAQIKAAAPSMKGSEIGVNMERSGGHTTYRIKSAAAVAFIKPVAHESTSLPFTLRMMASTMRSMAATLDELATKPGARE